MPITQTSLKSKNYNALGIDEIADDITNLIEEVNILSAGGGSDYTETIVNISSAQILTMGTTPIELLPAAGVGNYYDVEKIVIEFSSGAVQYTTGTITDLTYVSSSGNIINTSVDLIQATDNIVFMSTIPTYVLNQSYYVSKNESYSLTTNDSTNPTLGNGTLRVKIYHKTIIFGA